jgi:NhaP-type Na+/H+ and K+/H+ antiporter
MTVTAFFAERLDGAPQENDRVELGNAILVAHRVTDERVTLAGLLLDAPSEEEEQAAFLARRSRWARLMRRK